MHSQLARDRPDNVVVPLRRRGDGSRADWGSLPLWMARSSMLNNVARVMLALANYADWETGECFPSHAELRKITGLRRTSVQRAIEHAREAGLLEVNARHRSNGGTTSNWYAIAGWLRTEIPPGTEILPGTEIPAGTDCRSEAGACRKSEAGACRKSEAGACHTLDVAGKVTNQDNKPIEQTKKNQCDFVTCGDGSDAGGLKPLHPSDEVASSETSDPAFVSLSEIREAVKPPAPPINDHGAYAASVKAKKRLFWLMRLNHWSALRLHGPEQQAAFEAIAAASEAGSRAGTPPGVRQLLDQLDRLFRSGKK